MLNRLDQERRSNSTLKMTAVFGFLSRPCARYAFVSFNRPTGKEVSLAYWKENQVTTRNIFEQAQQYTKI